MIEPEDELFAGGWDDLCADEGTCLNVDHCTCSTSTRELVSLMIAERMTEGPEPDYGPDDA